MKLKIKLIILTLIIIFLVIFLYLNKNEPISISKSESIELKSNEEKPCRKFDIKKHLFVFIKIQKTGTTEFESKIQRTLSYRDQNNKNKQWNWKRICNNKTSFKQYKNPSPFQFFNKKSLNQNDKHDNYCNRYLKSNQYLHKHAFYIQYIDYLNNQTIFPDLTSRENDIFYYTRLRDPIDRYLSEWQFLNRTNRKEFHYTSVRDYHCENVFKDCWSEEYTTNLTLEMMLSCDTNLSKNRQTRMLALYDFDKTKCHLHNITDAYLLERAKAGIDSLFTFGLTEYQNESAELLTRTMSCSSNKDKLIYKFDIEIKQNEQTFAGNIRHSIPPHLMQKIIEKNRLDIQIYNYAKDVFLKRLNYYNIKIEK
jgi:hypothetical protein